MDRCDASLAALLAGLVGSPEPDAVARWIVAGTLRPWRCASLLLHVADGDRLQCIASHGVTPTQLRRLRIIDRDAPLPQAHVMRTGVAHGLEGAALTTEFPLLAGAGLPALDRYELRPVLHDTVPIGVLTVRIAGPADAEFHQAFGGVSDALALWLRGTSDRPRPARHSAPLRLSDRQQRILTGLRRDRTNAAIATELGFAVGTIKADIAAMSRMLGAHGREDLVQRAAQAGY